MTAEAPSSSFQLSLELGNDAMQSGADVAQCLVYLASQLYDADLGASPEGILRDVNGNRVGRWWVGVTPTL